MFIISCVLFPCLLCVFSVPFVLPFVFLFSIPLVFPLYALLFSPLCYDNTERRKNWWCWGVVHNFLCSFPLFVMCFFCPLCSSICLSVFCSSCFPSLCSHVLSFMFPHLCSLCIVCFFSSLFSPFFTNVYFGPLSDDDSDFITFPLISTKWLSKKLNFVSKNFNILNYQGSWN